MLQFKLEYKSSVLSSCSIKSSLKKLQFIVHLKFIAATVSKNNIEHEFYKITLVKTNGFFLLLLSILILVTFGTFLYIIKRMIVLSPS